MSRTIRTGGKIAALAALSTTAGLVLAAAPAYAADTEKHGNGATWQTSTKFNFDSPTMKAGNRKKVRGNVTLTVNKDGNWEMNSFAKNNRIAWRNVNFDCTLTYGNPHRALEFSIPRYRVDGGESRRGHADGYESQIQGDWRDIAEFGETTCTLKLG
jgi:hypothetical protein